MTLGRRRLGSHFITETQGPGLRYPDAPGIRARAPSSADTSLAGEIDSLAAHWDAHQSPRLPDYHFNSGGAESAKRSADADGNQGGPSS